MEEKVIIEKLLQWEEKEYICRDIFRMRQGEITPDELLQRWQREEDYLQIALDPEKFPDIVPAEFLLKDDRNVALSKHERYNPLALHVHDYFEMNYVLSGNCIQHFEDGASVLSNGDLCLLSPEAAHYIEAFSDDAIVLNLAIRQETFLQQFMSLPRKDSAISHFFMDNLYSKRKLRYLLVHSAGDAEIRHMILKMYGEELARDSYTDDILVSSMNILFNLLLRNHGDSMEAPPLRQSPNALTDAMLSYIHDHYVDVTLQQVADEFHFSRQYCSRLITDLTGCSFSDLVTGVRLGQGEDLLIHTFLSIDEISERLGYANPETFIRAFQRGKGITPGQFRKLRATRRR